MVVSCGNRLALLTMVESPLGFILIPAIPPAVHMLSRIRVFPVFLPVSNAHLDGELIPLPA